MPSAEFEPAIPATKRPQTYALDRAATGIGENPIYVCVRVYIYRPHNHRCSVAYKWMGFD
jgi:hypothetical protein